MAGQQSFHICQHCHQIVEKVYQKGYCKSCLVDYFRKYQGVLNESHALKSDNVKKKQLHK